MTNSRPTRFAIIALAALMLMGSSCTDKALKVAAVIVRGTSATSDVLRDVVQANAATMDPATQAKLLDLATKIKAASDIAAKLTNDYKSFPSGSRPSLHAVIEPLVVAFRDALASGLTGIKDATVRQRVVVILGSVEAALVVADSALGG